MTITKTLDYVFENGCSLIRFGEGELKNIMHGEFDPYQVTSNELVQELTHCLGVRKSNLLICTVDGYKHLFSYTSEARNFWILFFGRNRKMLKALLDKKYFYGSMNVSRFYIDFRNKSPRRVGGVVARWKKIWDRRNLVFVEGSGTKLGVGNDLFDNAASIRRVICPSKNAYAILPRIEKIVASLAQKDDLIIIALGPAATILACKLTETYGLQSLDVGHIDVEYTWYLHRVKEKRLIEGKYVNEGDAMFEPIRFEGDTLKYRGQIVADLS